VTYDENKRLTAEEALNHPFFKLEFKEYDEKVKNS
jgi:hypothetical protein